MAAICSGVLARLFQVGAAVVKKAITRPSPNFRLDDQRRTVAQVDDHFRRPTWPAAVQRFLTAKYFVDNCPIDVDARLAGPKIENTGMLRLGDRQIGWPVSVRSTSNSVGPTNGTGKTPLPSRYSRLFMKSARVSIADEKDHAAAVPQIILERVDLRLIQPVDVQQIDDMKAVERMVAEIAGRFDLRLDAGRRDLARRERQRDEISVAPLGHGLRGSPSMTSTGTFLRKIEHGITGIVGRDRVGRQPGGDRMLARFVVANLEIGRRRLARRNRRRSSPPAGPGHLRPVAPTPRGPFAGRNSSRATSIFNGTPAARIPSPGCSAAMARFGRSASTQSINCNWAPAVIQFEHGLAQARGVVPFFRAKIGDEIDGRGRVAGRREPSARPPPNASPGPAAVSELRDGHQLVVQPIFEIANRPARG